MPSKSSISTRLHYVNSPVPFLYASVTCHTELAYLQTNSLSLLANSFIFQVTDNTFPSSWDLAILFNINPLLPAVDFTHTHTHTHTHIHTFYCLSHLDWALWRRGLSSLLMVSRGGSWFPNGLSVHICGIQKTGWRNCLEWIGLLR